ncbi:ABC transporter ATP-binding protein [Anaeromicropila herbilytica]|uniref:Bacitracin ABC transporter ATP-binding protein n=1 Tax=Anaeromicropila herbilytica TaxID=2785025 RepID=A0A7R7EQ59_9FIRM|nr:ABC transporter ATP-binding protein [Anaeromicropila herbilytica]BCN32705.1 bacitracin ABC transporter ATP-binding protein [Anaeromicropila herbilytica]
MENCIEMQNISKDFGDKVVLKDINLNIKRGEIFGLLGPSGAGKTTLIKILTRQLKQSDGIATLMGIDTRELDQNTYSNLGMVLDNVGLYERLSCYDNLNLFTKIYNISKDRIESVLAKVGLLEDKKTTVMKLSKGMKQRLVLARALINEPKILFLDEPTSGLDPSTASEIHNLIVSEREKGTTIFLTTHNMEEATKLCNNVALLHEGKIVEYGNPKEICRKYNYQNKIKILLHTGETVKLENDETSIELISNYLKSHIIETIHSTEPNLETVFIELTGRSFS